MAQKTMFGVAVGDAVHKFFCMSENCPWDLKINALLSFLVTTLSKD